jgi:hypothetical protein
MDLTPDARARVDRAHAAAQGALWAFVEQARSAIAEHGPTDAPFYVAEHHIALTALFGPDQITALAGSLGLALVELASREAS